ALLCCTTMRLAKKGTGASCAHPSSPVTRCLSGCVRPMASASAVEAEAEQHHCEHDRARQPELPLQKAAPGDDAKPEEANQQNPNHHRCARHLSVGRHPCLRNRIQAAIGSDKLRAITRVESSGS